MKQKLREDMILPLNKVYRLETGECLYDYEGKKIPGKAVGYFLIDGLGTSRDWQCGRMEEGLAIRVSGERKGAFVPYKLWMSRRGDSIDVLTVESEDKQYSCSAKIRLAGLGLPTAESDFKDAKYGTVADINVYADTYNKTYKENAIKAHLEYEGSKIAEENVAKLFDMSDE